MERTLTDYIIYKRAFDKIIWTDVDYTTELRLVLGALNELFDTYKLSQDDVFTLAELSKQSIPIYKVIEAWYVATKRSMWSIRQVFITYPHPSIHDYDEETNTVISSPLDQDSYDVTDMYCDDWE